MESRYSGSEPWTGMWLALLLPHCCPAAVLGLGNKSAPMKEACEYFVVTVVPGGILRISQSCL